MHLVVRDVAVAGPTDRDVLHLGATVTERHHRLAAGLAPHDGAAELLRHRPEEELLGGRRDLRPEAAADVGGDDPHVVGFDAVRGDDRGLGALGVLGRDPLVQTAVDPGRRRAADLHRAGSDALVDEAARDDDLTVREVVVGRRVLRHAEHRRVEHRVRAGGVVDQGVGGERRVEIDLRRQEVDVDEHHLGGISRLGLRLGDDRHDGLTDEADLVAREQRARHHRVECRRDRLESERLGGEDPDDARHVLRSVDVDRQDRAVCGGRARVHDVEGASEQLLVHVVDVHPTGGEELGVLLALDSGPQNAAGHVCPLVLSVRAE